jgi:hypothetical protein
MTAGFWRECDITQTLALAGGAARLCSVESPISRNHQVACSSNPSAAGKGLGCPECPADDMSAGYPARADRLSSPTPGPAIGP